MDFLVIILFIIYFWSVGAGPPIFHLSEFDEKIKRKVFLMLLVNLKTFFAEKVAHEILQRKV
jgi:hypothetical protein